MRTHRRYHDELPIVWTVLIILLAFWISSCTSAADRQRDARDHAYRMKVMAEDWAWNGIPPPPGMGYNAWPSYPPPGTSPYSTSQPRMRTMCMQYGTLGQGGQLNCY